MSIVGTRPPLISETNLYEPRHKARLAIKPGITGMWQVSGRSDITDFEEVVRLDKEYIEKLISTASGLWSLVIKIYHSVGAEEVIDAILSAGGIPVLAHPMESLRGYDEESVKKLIGSLGIRNIEFLTPKHTAEEVEMLERIIIYYDFLFYGNCQLYLGCKGQSP